MTTPNYTNKHNISEYHAAWLAYDSYTGRSTNPYHISMTTLLKPDLEIVLGIIHKDAEPEPEDISTLRASAIGTAVHAAIEAVWTDPEKLTKAANALGWPQATIDALLTKGTVHTELRSERKIGKWTITGELDFMLQGAIKDTKVTGTFSHVKNTNAWHYKMQMSGYRWLNPDIETQSIGYICKIFTDFVHWKKGTDNYPQADMVEVPYQLLELHEFHAWLLAKLQRIERALSLYEEGIAQDAICDPCTNEQRWKDPSQWKYYKKPGAARATKDFKEDGKAAHRHLIDQRCGEVREFKGESKYCKSYCSARLVCDYAKSLG